MFGTKTVLSMKIPPEEVIVGYIKFTSRTMTFSWSPTSGGSTYPPL